MVKFLFLFAKLKSKLISSFIFICYLLFADQALANNTQTVSLNQSIQKAFHGIKFQTARMKIISENLANELSTADNPRTDPYRRKIIFAKNSYNKDIKTNVLKTSKEGYDSSEFQKRYQPGHPAADQDGYVKYPNVDKEIELADFDEASRSFEANSNVLKLTENLITKTIDMIK